METNQATLREPVESIKLILQWVADHPTATATISYSPDYGWTMTTLFREEVTYGSK